MLSSTVVTNALPRIVTDLEGSQTGYTWVVVATLLTMTATTPDLGQARRPLQQEDARAERPGDLLRRLAGRRAGAQHGGADRRPRPAGPRRRWPHRARPGRDREHGEPPRARALRRLHRCGLRARDGQRPAHRGRHRGLAAGLAGCFFIGLPVAALAFVVLQKTLHLPTIRREVHIDYLGATLHRRRGLDPAGLGVAWRASQFGWTSATSVAIDPGRPGGPRRGDLRRGPGRGRADHPAAALPATARRRSRRVPPC